MYYRTKTLGRFAAPIQPAAQNVTIPASTGGVNALDPLISLAPTDCYYTFNLMPSEYGLRLRRGYREWATGVGTAPFDEVNAIIPFEASDSANDKLFAATADGIYDITTEGDTSPAQVQAFSINDQDAGFCTWTEFVTDAGDTYLFVACPRNGLYQYTVAGGWARPTFTGVTVADVAFVALHKQRVWVVMQESTDSYYGPVAGISGGFTKFVWGSKFKYGGKLLGIYTWTLDGGDGVDDYLVGISRGGDVLSYRGPDPSDPAWELTGSFFVGEMPNSRRVVEPYAGELFILSTFGVSSLRDLVSGIDASDNARSASAKINRILRQAVDNFKDRFEWQMATYPADGFLSIIQPYDFENQATQYNQNLLTKGWGYWSDVPVISADTWQSGYYMGSGGGRVLIYSGVQDGVLVDGTGGDPISFSILTSFQAYGDHATYKRVGLMRVVSVTGGDAKFNMKAVYDYAINAEAAEPSGLINNTSSIWDTALWDTGVWSGATTGASFIEGAAGVGRTIAMAMKGSAATRLTIVGWDITLTTGGYL